MRAERYKLITVIELIINNYDLKLRESVALSIKGDVYRVIRKEYL